MIISDILRARAYFVQGTYGLLPDTLIMHPEAHFQLRQQICYGGRYGECINPYAFLDMRVVSTTDERWFSLAITSKFDRRTGMRRACEDRRGSILRKSK